VTVTEPIRHLVVGRLRKPHGLKGNVAIFPLTSDPDLVFAAGQQVGVKGLDGEFVDAQLRVHGCDALRVVDCGIMPTLVSGNTNVPVVMVAEKIAAAILADAR